MPEPKAATAYFEDTQDAQDAIAALKSNGFDEASIHAFLSADDAARMSEQLAGLGLDDDVAFYDEALRSGRSVVLVQRTGERYEQAFTTLRSFGGVDYQASQSLPVVRDSTLTTQTRPDDAAAP